MHLETRDSENSTNVNREAVGKMWYPGTCNCRNQLKKHMFLISLVIKQFLETSADILGFKVQFV